MGETLEQRTDMDVAAGEGSNQDAAVRIVPATAEKWPRLGHVFGSREKDPSSCWCQRFLRHGESDNRSALRRPGSPRSGAPTQPDPTRDETHTYSPLTDPPARQIQAPSDPRPTAPMLCHTGTVIATTPER